MDVGLINSDNGLVQQPVCFFHMFNDVDSQFKVRQLTSERIGKLLRITGQVVRTHPVHPELVLGTFKCADCQTIISDVEQQFKYTQVS